jgi:glycosyltransferase involved in cell wall biosynthesis
MTEGRVSIIVPVFDEAATVADVLARLDELPFEKEVIVVDDGSTDGTADVLERWASDHPDVLVVAQPHRGKGAAVRAGIARMTGTVVVLQDADGEYDPADIPALIDPIRRGVADVVYGSRLSGGRPQRAYLFWHLVGNRALALLTNVLYNTTLTDIETGYKVFRADVLRSLGLQRDDFGIEAEITARILKRHLRVYELPIAYYGRTYAEGKKITWRDGVRAVAILVRERVR